MKRTFVFLLVFILTVSNVFSARKASDKLVVASYSSFADSWGKGKDVVKQFETDKGIQVELLDLGSGFEFISALKSGKIKADVAVGIDDAHLNDFADKYSYSRAFDYGYYAFCYDTKSGLVPPSSLADIVKPEYKGKVILIDPRTSFVGFGLLRWAVAAFGEKKGFEWFGKAVDNSLTVAPSWSVGYSLFTKGEAPLVISYSTSPVYHYDNGENDITSLIFDEGNLETREYAIVFSDSKNRDNARLFVDYVAKNTVGIATTNVMYPVMDEDKLSESYLKVRKPSNVLHSDAGDELLVKWQASSH